MSSQPDLTIVVVSYNTKDFILPCLESVYRETTGVRFEIIVVDNASKDGSADAVATQFPAVRLIRSEKNLGFAAANNLAADQALGRYLLLLNPDTVVLTGTIEAAVRFLEAHPEAGIVGGRTLFADGSLNASSCWARATLWSVLCRALGLSTLFRGSPLFDPEAMGGWDRGSVREVDIVTGCFLLIGLELWRRLNGFDPLFFMYGEEADLCLRARRLGARPMITPDATLIHHGGASEPVFEDKLVRVLAARVLLMRVHWSRARAWLGAWLTALGCAHRGVAGRLLIVLGASVDETSVRGLSGAWRRRREWMGADHAR